MTPRKSTFTAVREPDWPRFPQQDCGPVTFGVLMCSIGIKGAKRRLGRITSTRRADEDQRTAEEMRDGRIDRWMEEPDAKSSHGCWVLDAANRRSPLCGRINTP